MFKQYTRKAISELRPVTPEEIDKGLQYLNAQQISVASVDICNGSPKLGDMIARNPINHLDQWLVAATYFNDNFEEL